MVEVRIGLRGSLHGLTPRDGRAETTADDDDATQPGSSPPSSNNTAQSNLGTGRVATQLKWMRTPCECCK